MIATQALIRTIVTSIVSIVHLSSLSITVAHVDPMDHGRNGNPILSHNDNRPLNDG